MIESTEEPLDKVVTVKDRIADWLIAARRSNWSDEVMTRVVLCEQIPPPWLDTDVRYETLTLNQELLALSKQYEHVFFLPLRESFDLPNGRPDPRNFEAAGFLDLESRKELAMLIMEEVRSPTPRLEPPGEDQESAESHLRHLALLLE